MIYAQFFQPSALNSTKLIEACGDRSVVILDGRSPKRHMGWAQEDCYSRGYLGYQLMQGENFSTAKPISELVRV